MRAKRCPIRLALMAVFVLVLLCLNIHVANAQTLRFASAETVLSADPHTLNAPLSNAISRALYQTLVEYNLRTFKIEGKLAKSWVELRPGLLRFKLDSRARFHDDSRLTSDDVVFSIKRAMLPESTFVIYTAGIQDVLAPTPDTVDFKIKTNTQVFLSQLTELRIMSKAWAVKNNASKPLSTHALNTDYHTYKHAMGTGPFTISQWDEGKRIVLQRSPNQWDESNGNLKQIHFQSIPDDGERMRALLAGQLEMVIDPPNAYLGNIKNFTGLRLSESFGARALFIGLDHNSEPLLKNSGKVEKNPLQNKLVRQALYQAIDINTLRDKVLNGMVSPTGTVFAPVVAGWTPSMQKRLSYNQSQAKALLAKAGYPNGFTLPFSCTSGRYLNDRQVCHAISDMWRQVGVVAEPEFYSSSQYFPMLLNKKVRGAYLLGWITATYDAHYTLSGLFQSSSATGAAQKSSYNAGNYSNPVLDALIGQIELESKADKRLGMIQRAMQIPAQDIAVIPLYYQHYPRMYRRNILNLGRFDYSVKWADMVVRK